VNNFFLNNHLVYFLPNGKHSPAVLYVAIYVIWLEPV